MIKLRNEQMTPSIENESKNTHFNPLDSSGTLKTNLTTEKHNDSQPEHSNSNRTDNETHHEISHSDKKDKKNKKKDKEGKAKQKDKKNKTAKGLLKTFELKHCTSYSVDGFFTNYGCYECESGYQLSSNLLGIGTCKGKSTITNCKTEIKLENDTTTTKCVQCNGGYGTNSTGKECKEVNSTQSTIPNCQSYFIDDDKRAVSCGRCSTGLTLSMDGTSCAATCNITNCDSCIELDGFQYCNSCSPGFIGVLGYPFNMINRCITTTDWLKKIFSGSILDELS